MNRKALLYALVYCFLLVSFRLYILLGGYALTTFGFYYSTITGVILIVPFYILAIKDVRDNENQGLISGREAMRIALTVFAVGAIVSSVYNYVEYKYTGPQMAEQHYRSEQFLDHLKKQPQVKSEDYQTIIETQILDAKGAAFKATTGKLFSLMLIGLSAAFITSALMKRAPSGNSSSL